MEQIIREYILDEPSQRKVSFYHELSKEIEKMKFNHQLVAFPMIVVSIDDLTNEKKTTTYVPEYPMAGLTTVKLDKIGKIELKFYPEQLFDLDPYDDIVEFDNYCIKDIHHKINDKIRCCDINEDIREQILSCSILPHHSCHNIDMYQNIFEEGDKVPELSATAYIYISTPSR